MDLVRIGISRHLEQQTGVVVDLNNGPLGKTSALFTVFFKFLSIFLRLPALILGFKPLEEGITHIDVNLSSACEKACSEAMTTASDLYNDLGESKKEAKCGEMHLFNCKLIHLFLLISQCKGTESIL